MYDICTDLKNTENITVIDLTKKFEKNDNCPAAYYDDNTTRYSFTGAVFNDTYNDKTYTFHLKDYQADEIEENYGYQNIELTHQNWPTKLQLLQDYGNHSGAAPENYINENLLLIGSCVDSESLGWFDGYYVAAVRYGTELFLYKICKADEINIENVRPKRPFSIWFYTKDKYETDESTVWCSISINGRETEYDIKLEVELENLKVRDLYNRQMTNFSLSHWSKGYDDVQAVRESEGFYDYAIGETVKDINMCNRLIEKYSKSDDKQEYYMLLKQKRRKEMLMSMLRTYVNSL